MDHIENGRVFPFMIANIIMLGTGARVLVSNIYLGVSPLFHLCWIICYVLT